jgi:arylsulfatase
MKIIIKVLLIALIVVCAATISYAAEKPNVVLMLADNLGFGDLSVYNGGTRGGMRTPQIDNLASQGMRFTQYLVEPGCTPSRAALMTGRYSIRSGLSLVIAPGAGGGLQADEITLAELFKSVGYNTTYIGKWHLGGNPQNQPQNQGFDQWLLGFAGSTDSTLYESHLKEFNAPEPIRQAFSSYIFEAKGPGKVKKTRPYNREYRKQIEADIAEEASKYIKDQARNKKPFFLMIGWTRPHFPNDPHDDFKGKSGVGKYGDSVVELDHRTGEVLATIKNSGIEENTIVIWVSDNGPTTTATLPDEMNAGDSGPFRGELGDAYEGSIRTAGMIKWPGKIKPGVSNEMFSTHDFMPTLANIIGAKMPIDRPIDGVDQMDFLLGRQEKSNRNHLISFIGDRLVAVRWNQFRIYPVEIKPSNSNPEYAGYLGTIIETAGFPEIYNIEADPKERNNISIQGGGWIIAPYLQTVQKYKMSLKNHPNPPAGNVTKY